MYSLINVYLSQINYINNYKMLHKIYFPKICHQNIPQEQYEIKIEDLSVVLEIPLKYLNLFDRYGYEI